MAQALTRSDYRDRVYGGWIGKNAGETLGAPFEGSAETHDLRFYDPIPGQPTAFDGTDLSMVWLALLREKGPDVTGDDLARAFEKHIAYRWDEYGWSSANCRRSLRPPLTGAFNNWFRHGIRAVSRCDLWAMVAPGAPQVAAAYVYADASIDHAEEGVWAAMFWAAMESAAFFVQNRDALLDIGLAMVPANSRVARAVRAARDCGPETASIMEARGRVLAAVGRENWSDAPQNIGFAVLGWRYGCGDFGASLTTAANLGYACQENAGALGCLLGILRGKGGLPEEWTKPIGEPVVVGWGVVDLDVERTVSDLVDHVVEAGESVVAGRCPDISLVDSLPEPPPPVPASPAEPVLAPAAPALDLHGPDAAPPLPQGPGAGSLQPESSPPTLDPPGAQAEPERPGVVLAEADRPGHGGPPADPVAPVTSSSAPVAAPGAELGLGVDAVATAAPVAAPPTPSAEDPTPVSAPSPPNAQGPTPPPSPNWADNALVKPLLVAPPNLALFHAGSFEFAVDYGEAGPAVIPNVATGFTVAIRNMGTEDFIGHVTLSVPDGWQVRVPGAQGQRQMLARGGMARYGFALLAPDTCRLRARNMVTLVLSPEKAPAITVDIPYLGGSCWWWVAPFRNMVDEGYDHAYGPEDKPGLDEEFLARDGGLIRWQKRAFGENVMDLESLFTGVAGVAYGQTTLHVAEPTEARLVAHNNDGVKIWFNGQRILQRHAHLPFRPSLPSVPEVVDVLLQPGDNRLLLKVVRCNRPIEFAFAVTDRSGDLLPDVGNPAW